VRPQTFWSKINQFYFEGKKETQPRRGEVARDGRGERGVWGGVERRGEQAKVRFWGPSKKTRASPHRRLSLFFPLRSANSSAPTSLSSLFRSSSPPHRTKTPHRWRLWPKHFCKTSKTTTAAIWSEGRERCLNRRGAAADRSSRWWRRLFLSCCVRLLRR